MTQAVDAQADTLVELYERPLPPSRHTICSESKFSVVFHHPAYHSSRLFEISAFDGKHGGIHHRTALLLCGIVAGGVWTGWLSEDKSGTRLTINSEAALTKRNYHFHLPYPPDETGSPSGPYKWPVVLSVEDFTFPHDRPPPGGTLDRPDAASSSFSNASVSSMSQAVKDRDEGCLMTGWRDGIERAHLCPRSIWSWFAREELERYNIRTNLSGATSVDDMANAITLTEVVHTALDKGNFIFVPKRGQWVSHFLDPTYNLGPEYHNVSIKIPTAVSEAFVFVSAVVAILSRHQNFFMRGEARTVIVKRETNTQRIIDMTSTDLHTMLDRSKRPGNKSPRKRSRDPNTIDELQDAVEVKRCCTSGPHPQRDETMVPTLITSETSSCDDVSLTDEAEYDHSDNEVETLRQRQLKEQRRLNKENCCCDYDAAEDAIARGIHGPPEYGGGYVCKECLGFEICEI